MNRIHSPNASGRRSGDPASSEVIRLLIVDDDQLHARLLRANLERPGRIEIEIVPSAAAALDHLTHQIVDAILSDVVMPEKDGIELVRRIRETEPSLPVILMTANATLERAVEGIRAGATDFLQKPVNATALTELLRRAVSERGIREEISAARERRAAVAAGNLVFGRHPALDAVRAFALQLAQTPGTRVLITGESGTGKSLLARMIHDLSGATGRFVEINCAALPPQLLESELFGHEKGAFTDAKTLKRGLIEAADRGTILLDEIGTLPLELQAKLLLFLESREVRRVGGLRPIPVQTRVIAATNEDLRERVRERRFRLDLLYRLDVASVEMPPLRRMPEVIPELAAHLTRELCAELRRPLPSLTESSFSRLTPFPWPGNTRELRNAIERALIFHAEGDFEVAPPPEPIDFPPPHNGVVLELGLTLEEVERRYIAATLEESAGELEEVAARLGISRKTLWDKRRRYRLSD